MQRSAALALAVAALLVAKTVPAEGPVRVAILPVVVHSLENHGYLRDGLADMLASRIGRAPGVAVVRVDAPENATTDPEAARETARALGADYVVYGSFTTFGQGASLDVACAPAGSASSEDGAPVRQIFVQSGTLGEIIPQLDGLAEKVARFATTGAAPVSSGPPERSTPAPSGSAGAGQNGAAPDLRLLLERVEALEKKVYTGDERVEESDLRSAPLEEEDAPASGAGP